MPLSREEKNALARERWRNRTPEERERKLEQQRKRRSRPDVRATENARTRETRKQWSQERRARANALNREWHRKRTPEQVAKSREYMRRYTLLAKFGLTSEQWDEIFERQGRACGCCGSTSPGSRLGWSTDHCHETGRVRGILCRTCNTQIGHLGDTAEKVVHRARQYLTYLTGAEPKYVAGRLVPWEPERKAA